MKKMKMMATALTILLTVSVAGFAGPISSNGGITAAEQKITDGERFADATVTVIHGIPGLPVPVDVYVNGGFAFSFDFNDSVDSIPLAPGSYLFEVKLQGTTVLSANAQLMSGKNYSAIAHLTYMDGSTNGIALSLFENNIDTLRQGRARVTVRHTADAPKVDLDLQRVRDLGNGFYSRYLRAGATGIANMDGGMPSQFGSIDILGSLYNAVLFPAGSIDAAFDSGTLPLDAGYSYIVYAIGSLFDGSFTLFVQAIDLR